MHKIPAGKKEKKKKNNTLKSVLKKNTNTSFKRS